MQWLIYVDQKSNLNTALDFNADLKKSLDLTQY